MNPSTFSVTGGEFTLEVLFWKGVSSLKTGFRLSNCIKSQPNPIGKTKMKVKNGLADDLNLKIHKENIRTKFIKEIYKNATCRTVTRVKERILTLTHS